MSTRVYVSPQDCPSNKAKGRNCMNWSDLFFVVIAQKFVQGKVSVVYSLKLLHSGEFPSQDMQSFWMTFHYNVYFFYLFQFLPFNQNKMWKLLEFEKTCARREKSKLTLKTLKHKISIANSYSYLVFAIICHFTITRKLTICLFLSRRALVFD